MACTNRYVPGVQGWCRPDADRSTGLSVQQLLKTGIALAEAMCMGAMTQNDELSSPLRERRWALAAFRDEDADLPPRWQDRRRQAKRIARKFHLPLPGLLAALRVAAWNYWSQLEAEKQLARRGYGKLTEARQMLRHAKTLKALMERPQMRNRLARAAHIMSLPEPDPTPEEGIKMRAIEREVAALFADVRPCGESPKIATLGDDHSTFRPTHLERGLLWPDGVGGPWSVVLARQAIAEIAALAQNACFIKPQKPPRGRYAELWAAAKPLIAFWEKEHGGFKRPYVWEHPTPSADFLSRCLTIQDKPYVTPETVVRIFNYGR